MVIIGQEKRVATAMARKLKPAHLLSKAVPCFVQSMKSPTVYAATVTGMTANKWEKKENTKPMYSFPLNSPHQSMIRFNVQNIVYCTSFSAGSVLPLPTDQFFAPI